MILLSSRQERVLNKNSKRRLEWVLNICIVIPASEPESRNVKGAHGSRVKPEMTLRKSCFNSNQTRKLPQKRKVHGNTSGIPWTNVVKGTTRRRFLVWRREMPQGTSSAAMMARLTETSAVMIPISATKRMWRTLHFLFPFPFLRCFFL
jgi:hypothetical protein